MNQASTSNYKRIVLNETPLIDVRAPIEFEKGAFYHAVNLPILDNNQRHEVGTRYQQAGNTDATTLGYQLVSGKDKADKISAWVAFLRKHPDAFLYCFRGGQRSGIAQAWIKQETGITVSKLEGGYKAFRSFLFNTLNQESLPFSALRLGGYTGSGKTILINQLKNTIDLEALANHRGSSFGNQLTPQPSQINFENNLAYRLIQKMDSGINHLIFEDESRNIGRCCIPKPLFDYLSSSPLILLEVSFEERVAITLDEYVVKAQQDFCDAYGSDKDHIHWSEYLLNSINRIKKRLGGALYQETAAFIQNAVAEQNKSGSLQHHRLWISRLLKDYYDPMYCYQIEKNRDKIVFKGDFDTILEYITNLD